MKTITCSSGSQNFYIPCRNAASLAVAFLASFAGIEVMTGASEQSLLASGCRFDNIVQNTPTSA